MIRIEIETMKTAVSELQRKRAILSNIKERMAKLAYAVSQQSYVEETVCELRKLKKRMGEIEENLRDLQEALEEICILIEKTICNKTTCFVSRAFITFLIYFCHFFQISCMLLNHANHKLN